MEFPEAGRGTYILILHLAGSATLSIGQLGTFDFPSGWYAYVGSALHSSGLRGRLRHHLGPVRRPHWHIDYLRQAALIEQVWYLTSDFPHEHRWASWLAERPGAAIPARRFGASDCTCEAHLFHFGNAPDFDQFRAERENAKCWTDPDR